MFDIYGIRPKLNYLPYEKIDKHIPAKNLSRYLTPLLQIYLEHDKVRISITADTRFTRLKSKLKSNIPDFASREEAIAFLDNELKRIMQESADSVNDATALTPAIFKYLI